MKAKIQICVLSIAALALSACVQSRDPRNGVFNENVYLKYRINLDGEATNFYEENQELSWEQRQWVKLNPAKNDLSDIAAMGTGFADLMNHCGDVGESSAALNPQSVVIDDAHNYLQ